MHIHIYSNIMFTHNASVLPISPNMGDRRLVGQLNGIYFFWKSNSDIFL